MAFFEMLSAKNGLVLLGAISIKVVFLVLIVWFGVRCLRVHSAAVRHRVATFLLVGMLLMPALVFLVPAIPMGFVLNNPDAGLSVDSVANQPSGSQAEKVALRTNSEIDNMVQQQPLASVAEPQHDEADQNSKMAKQANENLKNTITSNFDQKRQAFITSETTSARDFIPGIAKIVLAAYLVGVLVFLGYLTLGYLETSMMLRRSRPVQLPKMIGNSATFTVVESEEVQVPATVGILQPKVVLPIDWTQWDEDMLTLVIAHETRHVRRRDTSVLLLSLVNRIVYWFHPLSWILAKQISKLAELACDEEIVLETGNRTAYANCLVEMASRLSNQTKGQNSMALSLGMARAPMVEQRVERIMNFDRSTNKKPGAISVAATLVLVVATAIITASVGGFASAESRKESASSIVANGDEDSIKGKVLGLDGSPVAGATVFLRTIPNNSRRYKKMSTVTDEQGEFLFKGFVEGEHRLSAYHGKHSSRTERFRGHIVEPGEQAALLKLKKVPSLSVKIVSRENKPIENAQVVIQYIDNGRHSYPADSNGEVTIERLTAETWTIKTKAPGFAQQDQAIALIGAGNSTVKVTLSEPGADLFGTVRDEGGNPIKGVSVLVRTFNERADLVEFHEFSSKTDADGKYQLTGLPIHKRLRVTVYENSEFKELDTSVMLDVAAGQRHKLDLSLVSFAKKSVSGKVVDVTGTPIVGAVISSRFDEADRLRGKTDDNGNFVLPEVRLPNRLVIQADGFLTQGMSIDENLESNDLAITLHPGVRVTGRIVDVQGNPISGVRIHSISHSDQRWIDDAKVVSDSKGEFVIDSLPADQRLSCYKEGYSPVHIDSTAEKGTELGNITLPVGGMIRGRVLDEVTGEPITTFKMHYTFSPDPEPNDPKNLMTMASHGGDLFANDQGMFEVRGKRNGMPLQVTVEAKGYQKRVLRRVFASSEAEAKVDEYRMVRLDPANVFSLNGQVTDPAGDAIAGVELRLIVTDQRDVNDRNRFPFNWEMIFSEQILEDRRVAQYLRTTTDAKGRFSFSDIQNADDIELVYWGEGIVRGRQPGIEKLSAEKRKGVLVLANPAGNVKGKLDSAAYSYAMPSIRGGDGSTFRADISDDRKSYQIRNLPPGEHEILIHSDPQPMEDGGFTTRIVKKIDCVVKAGKTVIVDVSLDRDRSR